MVSLKKTPNNAQGIWMQAERPAIAAVSSYHGHSVTQAAVSILRVRGPALRHLGVTKTPPWTAVNFGLDQQPFCPQRVIFLLPHFLRVCLAFENEVLVDSFLKSDKQPAL